MHGVDLLEIPPEGPSSYRFDDISLDWYYRSAYDFIFFPLIIIILMNIVFGIIIDTFSDLRSQRDELKHADCVFYLWYWTRQIRPGGRDRL